MYLARVVANLKVPIPERLIALAFERARPLPGIDADNLFAWNKIDRPAADFLQ
jgi:hypothetical protein